MAIVTIGKDLGQISDSFEPIPEGTYLARIISAEPKTSSSGNPMVEVVWEIQEGEFTGRKIWDYLVLTENSYWKVKRYCKRLLGLESGEEFDTSDFEGIDGVITVEIQAPTEGGRDPRNQIRDVEAA